MFLKSKVKIDNWLKSMGIDVYTITPNLVVDVYRSVDISNRMLKEIPVKFGIVDGQFDCSGNLLTSLKGSPYTVSRDFLCDRNQLTSLKGSPVVVGGSFVCSSNDLTNLDGCPYTIGKDINCDNNLIKTLKFSPDTVGRDFKCRNNPIRHISNFKCKFERSLIHDSYIIPGLANFYKKEKSSVAMDWNNKLDISYIELQKALVSVTLHQKLSAELPKQNGISPSVKVKKI